MGMLELNQLMASLRQWRRQQHRRHRQIQARDGSTYGVKRKCSPCQNYDNSLDAEIEGYSGPHLPEDIWFHIHSRMPMPDAAQTACVSQAFLGDEDSVTYLEQVTSVTYPSISTIQSQSNGCK